MLVNILIYILYFYNNIIFFNYYCENQIKLMKLHLKIKIGNSVIRSEHICLIQILNNLLRENYASCGCTNAAD